MVLEAMDRTECGSKKYTKDGIVKGKQCNVCKSCKYRYTIEQRAGSGSKASCTRAIPGRIGC